MESLYGAHLRSLCQSHDEALAHARLDAVATHSGCLQYVFMDDTTYPFKPNAPFKHWLPLTQHPDCWVVYRSGGKPLLIYYQPQDYWHSTPQDPNGFWVEHFDIRVIREPRQAQDHLPHDLSRVAFIGEDDRLAHDLGFTVVNPPALIAYLDYRRAYKTDYEIACMRKANALAAGAHRAAEQGFRQGSSEYDIHQDYLRACGHTEAALPYGNIVAINEHAAVLHHQQLDRQAPTQPRSFLIDAGATFQGYASDVTRTYTSAPGLFQDLIDAMDSAQLRLVDGARNQVDYKQLHLSAHRAVSQILSDFGIVDMSAEDMVASGVSGTFLPHGLGHLLGLQVHDAGGLQQSPQGGQIERPEGHPYLRLTRVLEAGFVLTIEPGLYFIQPLLDTLRQSPRGKSVDWDKVASLVPYGGIRIEDNICVNAAGAPENLTRDAFAAA